MKIKWNKPIVNDIGKHWSFLAFTKGKVEETKVYILTLFIINISLCVS